MSTASRVKVAFVTLCLLASARGTGPVARAEGPTRLAGSGTPRACTALEAASLVNTAPAFERKAAVRRPEAGGCSEAAPAPASAPPRMRSKMFHQLRYHQSFPTHRAALIDRAALAAELTAEELTWLRRHLESPHYPNARAVFLALFPGADVDVLVRLEPAPAASGAAALAQRD